MTSRAQIVSLLLPREQLVLIEEAMSALVHELNRQVYSLEHVSGLISPTLIALTLPSTKARLKEAEDTVMAVRDRLAAEPKRCNKTCRYNRHIQHHGPEPIVTMLPDGVCTSPCGLLDGHEETCRCYAT